MSSLQRNEDFLASNLFRCYAAIAFNIFSETSQFNSARSILKMGEIEGYKQFQFQ